MNLIKQDTFIVVKCADEMPKRGERVSVSFNEGVSFSYEAVGKDWKAEEVNYTHWLKPIKQVYVLTEDELVDIMEAFRDSPFYNAKEFFKLNNQ